MELILLVELVPNVNQITHRIELELELMPKIMKIRVRIQIRHWN